MKTLSQEQEYRINCFTTKSNYGKGKRGGNTLSFVFSLPGHTEPRCDQSKACHGSWYRGEKGSLLCVPMSGPSPTFPLSVLDAVGGASRVPPQFPFCLTVSVPEAVTSGTGLCQRLGERWGERA